MLDDREQRVLDATEAGLGHEDPELAACLRDHRFPPRRARRLPTPARGTARVHRALWPPLIMFLICLLLVIVPAVVTAGRAAPPPGTGGAATSQPDRR